MIAQWSKGLYEPVQKSGCLMLCYLWAGWLWSIRDRGLKQDTPYPSVHDVNGSYDLLMHFGAVGQDCFVRDPARVVSVPWYYWDGCLLDKEPRVVVEKIPPYSRGHVRPIYAVGDGHVAPPPQGALVVDVTRWSIKDKSHFTAVCDNPAGYFDPWVDSTIARQGTAESVRRVTLVSE